MTVQQYKEALARMDINALAREEAAQFAGLWTGKTHAPYKLDMIEAEKSRRTEGQNDNTNEKADTLVRGGG